MMATMKACKLVASKRHVEIMEVPAPFNPKPGHVIVKVAYAGTCGSDLLFVNGGFPARDGVTLGHEVTGIIHKVGEGVIILKTGDRVALNPCSACNGCRFCHRGRSNICAASGVGQMLGMFRDGGWANYCEVPSADAVSLPETLSLKQAVLSEPMSCIVNGWNRMGQIPADAKILVMGAGTAGLLFASLFHYKGHRDITITSRTEKRRCVAAQMGLELNVSSLDEVAARYNDRNNPSSEGFDVIIEATGSEVALERAIPWLRCGGKMIVYGLSAGVKFAKIPVIDIVVKEIEIIGTVCASNSFADAVAFINTMTRAHYLDFDKLDVHMYKIDQINEALDSLHNKDINKAVFEI